MRTFIFMLIAAVPGMVYAQDYPTREVVENVILCMSDMGEQSEENLYACACRWDVVAAGMSFKEYEQARVYERYKPMPGDKGGEIRDAKQAKMLAARLDDLRAQGEKQCPIVRRVERPGAEAAGQ